MIDVNSEQVISFAELAKRLPRRRAGQPVHVGTIHRWRRPGIRGIAIEAVKIGGVWCTSLQAYARWVERLTSAAAQGEPRNQAAPSERARNEHGVERQLDDLGI